MREVGWRVDKIIERGNSRMEFQAVIHDKQMKESTSKSIENMTMTEEKEMLIERAHKEAQKRMARSKNGR